VPGQRHHRRRDRRRAAGAGGAGAQRRSLAQALADYRPLPQKTVNVRVAPASKPLEADSVQAARAKPSGARGRGRLVLRPSGTEPVVRVTVEAADAALMEQVLERLSAAVRAAV
jgi:phosphoglucosamine mutase